MLTDQAKIFGDQIPGPYSITRRDPQVSNEELRAQAQTSSPQIKVAGGTWQTPLKLR